MADLDTGHWVRITAAHVHRTYARFVSQDDLRQEGFLYIYKHPKKLATLAEYDKPKAAEHILFMALREAMTKYAREAKAQQSGYRPEDEAQYGSQAVSYLLPYVLKGQVPTGSQNGTQGVPGGSNDPAEGGNLLAGYLDVKMAWEKADLTVEDRNWLKLRHLEELTNAECGQRMGGVSEAGARKAVRRAETKLLDVIGGRPFHLCSISCECQDDTWRTEQYGLSRRASTSVDDG